MPRRRPESIRFFNLALLVVFLCAFGLRIAYVRAWPLPPDTDSYREISNHLLAGRGFSLDGSSPTAYRPPGYPLFLAVLEGLTGSPWAALYVQCFLGAVVTVMTALVARRIVGEVFAPLAGLAVAVDPFSTAICAQFMSEALFAFLATGALFLLLRAVRTRRSLRYVAAGLAIGAAAVTRSEFLLFVPAACAVVLVRKRSRRGICLALMLVATALPPLAWAARNKRALGSWIFTSTHGGYTHLLAYNDRFYREVVAGTSDVWSPSTLAAWQSGLAGETAGMSETERDRYYYEKASRFIRENPSAAAHTAAFGALRFWRPYPHRASSLMGVFLGGFFVCLSALAIMGLFAAWRRGPVAAVILYMLLAEAIHMYYWSNVRMRIPFHPLLAILACAGVATLFGRRALIGPAIAAPEEDPLYSPAV
ncbi:MAG: ArnT family glycosyltransferase [Planctomycetota bacterium]|jgi:4-amino-4-deoxy-L-arabinose transferase-like glycosyltransferase